MTDKDERPKLPPGWWEDDGYLMCGDGTEAPSVDDAWDAWSRSAGLTRTEYEAMQRAAERVNRGIEKCGDIIDAHGNDGGAVMAAEKILAALSAGEGVADGE